MPLNQAIRDQVLTYCDKDRPDETSLAAMFDFIDDARLREQVVSEFLAARYNARLGEALAVAGNRLHAHMKFQIVQYAGIYEVIIIHFLRSRFSDHPAVVRIELHDDSGKSTFLPKDLDLSVSYGKKITLSFEVKKNSNRTPSGFEGKVAAAVQIGFLDEALGEEIKMIYKVRNGIHIQNVVGKEPRFDPIIAKLAFQRMKPFTSGLKRFLNTGVAPDHARPDQPMAAAAEAGTTVIPLFASLP